MAEGSIINLYVAGPEKGNYTSINLLITKKIIKCYDIYNLKILLTFHAFKLYMGMYVNL